MRLIFYGELRKRFGPDAEINAESIADAIEGYSRQVDWPRDMLIEVVGHDTPELLQECPREIHLMPAMMGGGGKFGSILMGAALIGATFLLPGIGVAIGAAMKASIIVSGALMIAQGVVGLFMKAPKLGKNEDPEASKYLSVNRNTTAVGTPITMAWGRIDLAGQWLSLQSDSTNLSYANYPANPT